jgi:hypothetical protein
MFRITLIVSGFGKNYEWVAIKRGGGGALIIITITGIAQTAGLLD